MWNSFKFQALATTALISNFLLLRLHDMAQNFDNQYSYEDHIVVRHSDGKSEKFPGPAYPGNVLRLGRELDNDIILTDPRTSRYHAEIRRNELGDLDVRDLESANGVIMGSRRIEPNRWTSMVAGQTLQLAETHIFWEEAVASQPTVAMRPAERVREETVVSAAPPPVAPPPPQPAAAPAKKSSLPLLAGILALLLFLLLLGGAVLWFLLGQQPSEPPVVDISATQTMTALEQPQPKDDGSDLDQQAVSAGPTDTPTPSGPQLAIPVLSLIETSVEPILLGALPDPDRGLLVVRVRVQNLGNIPFVLSTNDFSLRTRDGSQVFSEAGGTTSEDGLKRLGVINRFNDLNLTPGGSVPETIIFEVESQTYNFELLFEPTGIDPIFLGLGTFDAGTALASALGIEPTPTITPTATTEAVVVAQAEATVDPAAPTATPTVAPTDTPEPTPTATRPALIPAPNVVPQSALAGTIAYPVFNGATYDLYFGQVDGSGTQFFRGSASQPTFSADGSKIAFRSWANDSIGLMTMDVSGGSGVLVTTFVEDQLPTWSADNGSIIFLTRRTGDRKSQLFRASSSTERDDGVFVTEGEHPFIGATGQLVFKGWGNTAFGLRLASSPDNVGDLQNVTNTDEDTAPALSPDGSQVAFMSRREGQWDVFVANIDGSNLQRLTIDEAEDGLPTWSPDGNAIAFVSNRGGPWAIWVMTPEGDGKSQVITMEGSPDGFVGGNPDASRGWAEERISWTR